MALLKKAVNEQAFLKAGILGFAGSGKTYTAASLAIGISKRLGNKKPVAFFDTETGSDFLIPRFEAEGIELLRVKSQSFSDLLEVGKEAEQSCSVLIVDSITHVWRELCEAYQKKTKWNRLEFQDWAVIKREWALWTTFFLNSRIHIIIAGRAGFDYDFEVNEKGKKELIKTGTKMKVENEFGFEPSLLIEMERAERGAEVGSGWKHRAHILKDRTDTINGKVFDFEKQSKSYKAGDFETVFKSFKPVFDSLNIGGEHKGFDVASNSQDRFDAGGDSSYTKRKQQLEIVLEEIQGTLTKYYPGQDAASKALKMTIIESLFATRSWKAVELMKLEDLQEALSVLRSVEDQFNIELTPEDISRLIHTARDEFFKSAVDLKDDVNFENAKQM